MSAGTPSISKKEAKICRAISQEYFLRVTDPVVLYGDLGCKKDDHLRKIVAELACENYKLRFFILEIIEKYTKYVVVLAPAEKVEENPAVETLE